MPNTVRDATTATFDEIVLRSTTPVVVDFWAPWCMYCKKLAPIYDQLSATMPNLKFVKVNVEDEPQLQERYGISGLPTLKFFCDGREVGELIGAPPKDRIEASFRQIVGTHKECLAASSPTKA